MDYAQMKKEKEERYEKYRETYAEQLQLQGYIDSLERDNESIKDVIKTAATGRIRRYNNKILKINNKDIKKYQKALSAMPALRGSPLSSACSGAACA